MPEETGAPPRLRNSERRVLEVLEALGHLQTRDLALETGLDPRTVRMAVNRLRDFGLASTDGRSHTLRTDSFHHSSPHPEKIPETFPEKIPEKHAASGKNSGNVSGKNSGCSSGKEPRFFARSLLKRQISLKSERAKAGRFPEAVPETFPEKCVSSCPDAETTRSLALEIPKEIERLRCVVEEQSILLHALVVEVASLKGQKTPSKPAATSKPPEPSSWLAKPASEEETTLERLGGLLRDSGRTALAVGADLARARSLPYERVRRAVASVLLKRARRKAVRDPAGLLWALIRSGPGEQFEEGADGNWQEVDAVLENARKGLTPDGSPDRRKRRPDDSDPLVIVEYTQSGEACYERESVAKAKGKKILGRK